MTGTTETAVGTGVEQREEATASTLPTTLLTAADIELELRRLIRRLIAGVSLLHRSRSNGDNADDDDKVLLDLEVDAVRCVLTRQLAADHQSELRLTPREREVARMVALGLTNTAIAGKLAVSPWTVSTHLRRIFAKLDVTTRAAMVAVIVSAESDGLAVVATRPPAQP